MFNKKYKQLEDMILELRKEIKEITDQVNNLHAFQSERIQKLEKVLENTDKASDSMMEAIIQASSLKRNLYP